MCSLLCSGDGRIVLSDSALKKEAEARGLPPPMPAVDLDLEKVIITSGYIFLVLCFAFDLCQPYSRWWHVE